MVCTGGKGHFPSEVTNAKEQREVDMLTHDALMQIATQAYGEDQGGGNWSEKDAYDLYEVAMNIYQMERMAGSGALQRDAKGAKAIVGWIKRNVESQLPKQTVRDEKAGDFQQFSTPPSYAYAINWIANITENDIVLEPSAGTGNIATFPQIAGARVFVNEMEPSRQKLLELLGFELFREDALQLGNILGESLRPTVVVMNPPFSQTGGAYQEEADSDRRQSRESRASNARAGRQIGRNRGRWYRGKRQAKSRNVNDSPRIQKVLARRTSGGECAGEYPCSGSGVWTIRHTLCDAGFSYRQA